MALSPIPLTGIVHIVALKRPDGKIVEDGVIKNNTLTTIIAAIKCRITLMSNEDEQKIFGNATGRRWVVLAKYTPEIQRSDFLTVGANQPAEAGEYRVTWFKQQNDHEGRWHHTSIVMELEDGL